MHTLRRLSTFNVTIAAENRACGTPHGELKHQTHLLTGTSLRVKKNLLCQFSCQEFSLCAHAKNVIYNLIGT